MRWPVGDVPPHPRRSTVSVQRKATTTSAQQQLAPLSEEKQDVWVVTHGFGAYAGSIAEIAEFIFGSEKSSTVWSSEYQWSSYVPWANDFLANKEQLKRDVDLALEGRVAASTRVHLAGVSIGGAVATLAAAEMTNQLETGGFSIGYVVTINSPQGPFRKR